MKKLSERTMGEVKKRCTSCINQHRDECPLDSDEDNYCTLRDMPPDSWELETVPRLTEDEMAVCRLLKSAGFLTIHTTRNGDMYANDGIVRTLKREATIPNCLFPSLKPEQDECYLL